MVPPYIKPEDTVISGPYEPVVESQITDSEGHSGYRQLKAASGDVGGEFFTQKRYLERDGSSAHLREETTNEYGNTEIVTYDGPAYPITPTTTLFPPSGQSSIDRLDELGATAVARCKPTNSVADVSTAIAELWRERLPHIAGQLFWKGRVDSARKAGSEYLNTEFGWVPLAADISDFFAGVFNADRIMRQLERDSGKVVRRRYNFPQERERSSLVVQANTSAALPPGIVAFLDRSNLGDLVRTRETVRNQWFSGAFTYELPPDFISRSVIGRYALIANKVFGVTLTPEVIWNLTPWSWALDWFTNTGDVISNLTDWGTEGLIMRYGYMMEHSIVKDSYALTKSGHRGLGASSVANLTFVTETKIRRRANPFGFGLTWDGLSPRQLAIAAALGLSRS